MKLAVLMRVVEFPMVEACSWQRDDCAAAAASRRRRISGGSSSFHGIVGCSHGTPNFAPPPSRGRKQHTGPAALSSSVIARQHVCQPFHYAATSC